MELNPNPPLLLDNGDDEQKVAEQGLQGSVIPYTTILEHVPESVLVLDMQWRIIYHNRQAKAILQKTRSELSGCTIWEAIPEAQDASFFQYCQQARTTGKTVSFEYLSTLFNLWFQVHIYPSEEGICIYFQDITQRKEFEEQRDEFIMSLSHELRTPLTSLIGFLELMRDFQERLDPPTRTLFLSRSLESCFELKHLVNSVLEALIASNATHPVNLESLVVCQIVSEVLAQFDPDAKQTHELTVMISEDVSVWADKQYLQQVLRNLLSNAFKYAPQQTSILLSANQGEENSQTTAPVPQVCICVQDAGPGIPLAEQSWLFKKFKRLKRDLTSTVRGTGLGLYICKQLVEMMEGQIWVESSGRAGEGSRFCFTLPEAKSSSLRA